MEDNLEVETAKPMETTRALGRDGNEKTRLTDFWSYDLNQKCDCCRIACIAHGTVKRDIMKDLAFPGKVSVSQKLARSLKLHCKTAFKDIILKLL